MGFWFCLLSVAYLAIFKGRERTRRLGVARKHGGRLGVHGIAAFPMQERGRSRCWRQLDAGVPHISSMLLRVCWKGGVVRSGTAVLGPSIVGVERGEGSHACVMMRHLVTTIYSSRTMLQGQSLCPSRRRKTSSGTAPYGDSKALRWRVRPMQVGSMPPNIWGRPD